MDKNLPVDYDNVIQGMLDSLEFTGINSSSVYSYNKSFSPVGSAYYKVYINYQVLMAIPALRLIN